MLPNVNTTEIIENSKNTIWGWIKMLEAYLEGLIGTDINGEFLGLCGLGVVVLLFSIFLGRRVIDKIFFNY